MLLRPALLVAALGIGDSGGPPGRWLPRLLAVREITLGAAVAAGSGDTGNPYPGLMTLSLVDAGEAVILLLALRVGDVAPARGWAFVAADAGSALAGAGAITQLRRAGRHR